MLLSAKMKIIMTTSLSSFNSRELAMIYKSLGNIRRILILIYLLKQKELTVGQISELLKLSFKSVSKHLLILENAEIIKKRQIGLNMLYSINKNFPRSILFFLKKLSY